MAENPNPFALAKFRAAIYGVVTAALLICTLVFGLRAEVALAIGSFVVALTTFLAFVNVPTGWFRNADVEPDDPNAH